MASFDNTSLFTNIPVNEIIDTILDRLFGTCDQHQGFTKKQFSEMLNLCTGDNIFLFQERMYKQFEGAPMGGCISPSQSDLL